MALIEVTNVSKRFRRKGGRRLLRHRIGEMFGGRTDAEGFYAVRNVSFQIQAGESVALIGSNGAGKSTMLGMVAGVAVPDEGSVRVNGRVAALLDLGAGFHPELTGLQNLFMNAALLGLSEAEVKARCEEIVAFAELEKSIHETLRTYSSGMILRLGFSIAVHSDPALLIVDEVLGVGDGRFQEKSASKVAELRRKGVTLLCVSHNVEMVTSFCDHGLWLHQGELVQDGPAKDLEAAYTNWANNPVTDPR
ncbi:MAG: ABC transporter ATP-binding protein [Bryobacteraceae bacterium]